jgi:hypothetical protein
MKRACIILASLMPWPALGGEYPDVGFVQDPQRHYFIKFECDPPTEQGMHCKFSEGVVHKNGGPEALAKALAELADNLRKGVDFKKETERMCAEIGSNMAGIIQAVRNGTKTAPPGMTQSSLDSLQAKPAPARADTLTMFESLQKVCASPTKESLENMARVQNDKETRTCELSLYTWEQDFIKQSDALWVHNGQPDGVCGVIDIATLEKDDHFWNYRTHSVVTNKNAIKDNTVFDCHKVDEAEHFYKWNAGDAADGIYVGCDYIKYP